MAVDEASQYEGQADSEEKEAQHKLAESEREGADGVSDQRPVVVRNTNPQQEEDHSKFLIIVPVRAKIDRVGCIAVAVDRADVARRRHAVGNH